MHTSVLTLYICSMYISMFIQQYAQYDLNEIS